MFKSKILNFIIKYKWLFLILIIGAFIRLFLLGVNPPGLNQDEAVAGYDAYSILKTGMDHNGNYFPVHLVSFGSGQSSFYSYLSIPFIAVFGLNPFATRLASALMGIMTIFLMFLVVRKTYNNNLALIAAFFVAISPWNIMMSRWGLECNAFPPVFMLAFTILLYGFERKVLIPVAYAFFCLCLYTYGTSYLLIPLWLIILTLYLYFIKKIDWKILMISGIVTIISALPMFLYVIINTFHLNTIKYLWMTIPRLPGPTRFSTESSVLSGRFWSDAVDFVARTFDILFIKGHDPLIHNSLPDYKILYSLSIPFVAVGLFAYFKKIKIRSMNIFWGVWFFIPLILSFNMEPNINRYNIIILPIIFMTAAGLDAIEPAWIKKILIGAYCCFFLSFCQFYFQTYPGWIGGSFYESFGDAVRKTQQIAAPKETITVNIEGVGIIYALVLYYNKIDPILFITNHQYYNPGDTFQSVKSFDRYVLGDFGTNFPGRVAVINAERSNTYDPRLFQLIPYKYYTVAIKNIRYNPPADPAANRKMRFH